MCYHLGTLPMRNKCRTTHSRKGLEEMAQVIERCFKELEEDLCKFLGNNDTSNQPEYTKL